MSKAVLISIQPKWCELIANGQKTIEVRKSRPKLETPFKVYIYCTLQGSNKFFKNILNGNISEWNKENWGFKKGKVIGEFICNKMSEYEAEFHKDNEYYQDIREIFRYDDNPDDDCRDFKILTSNDEDNADDCELCKRSCLSFDDFKNYIGEGFCNPFYGWHISDLVIYDKPKELSEFYSKCNEICEYCDLWQNVRVNADEYDMDCSSDYYGHKPIKRPPQSWCYVEECGDNA